MDPYARNLVNRNYYRSKTPVRGKVVAVLDGMLENRALELIMPISRAFCKHAVIELIGTDEPAPAAGEQVNAICYIAFVEIEEGGIALKGDEVHWRDKNIGTIAGFDDTHMPNHQNTIVKMKGRVPGAEMGIACGDEIIITGFNFNNHS